MKLIAGNSNPHLARAIANFLESELVKVDTRYFADREIFVEIMESVRGQDVFLIQSTCEPSNDNVMELLIMLDALRRSSPRRVTAVIPYFGYSRQDRLSLPRTPITARLMADLLEAAGADRVLTIDLHATQIL
jgi:ribose-phosphate pyrophosphokinase